MDSKELRNLQEAYLDVYQEQQLDESDDLESLQSAAQKSVDRLRRGNRITRAGAHIAAHKVARDVKKASAYGPQRPRAGQTGAYRIEGPKPSGSKPGAYRMEQVDIYDIILSHLLDEGYAETPEAAEAIMVNMSEEWRDSIVEEFDELDEGKVELDKERRSRMGRQIGKKVRSAEAEYSLSKDTMYPKELRGAMEKGARKKVGQAQKIMGALKSAQKSDG